MPRQLDDKYQQFSRFYSQKHQRRKITIKFTLGDAIVTYHIPNKAKPHELRVSTMAMFTLLLFNE